MKEFPVKLGEGEINVTLLLCVTAFGNACKDSFLVKGINKWRGFVLSIVYIHIKRNSPQIY